jgi:hypothetical protein
VFISVVPRDTLFLENHSYMTGGTIVTPCVGSFYEMHCKWKRRGWPAEWAHAMRWDADAQYSGWVHDEWIQGSPQKTSLCGIVNRPSCPADILIQ